MIISEKQVFVLISYLTNLTTDDDLSLSKVGREKVLYLLNEIVNQQSDQLKEIE